jgi:N-acetylglutamate synthase-like GNAT family acetyltransferase
MHNIRQAVEADSETIKQMVSNEHLDPSTLKWQNFLIAEQAGEIVGIGQIKPYDDCQELGSLVVLPEYRNQGIASALIEALEARAKPPLYLMCERKMKPYYERFGYHVIGWRETPRTLLMKRIVTLFFVIFGIRMLAMRKD